MFRKFALSLLLLIAVAFPAFGQSVATSQVTVTPNAAAYTAAQCLGGVLTIGGLLRGGENTTVLFQETIVDSSGTNTTIDLYFFNTQPSGTYTDHANCVIAAADQPFLIGFIANTAFTCAKDSGSASGICQANGQVLISPPTPSLKTVWMVPIMRGTPTYGAGKTLYFNLAALPAYGGVTH